MEIKEAKYYRKVRGRERRRERQENGLNSCIN